MIQLLVARNRQRPLSLRSVLVRMRLVVLRRIPQYLSPLNVHVRRFSLLVIFQPPMLLHMYLFPLRLRFSLLVMFHPPLLLHLYPLPLRLRFNLLLMFHPPLLRHLYTFPLRYKYLTNIVDYTTPTPFHRSMTFQPIPLKMPITPESLEASSSLVTPYVHLGIGESSVPSELRDIWTQLKIWRRMRRNEVVLSGVVI
ncbi:uncharacterized protein LOC141685992 [Apium graveolens]|uniref:uncharacterized protein LOC141685992 n=1 Tax=Apium graveolens TaxID=4045 RepID=UPI003D78C31D